MQGLGRFFWITIAAFLAAWVVSISQAALDIWGGLEFPIELGVIVFFLAYAVGLGRWGLQAYRAHRLRKEWQKQMNQPSPRRT